MTSSPRVAWLPAGSMTTASSRLRAYLPCRYLSRAGWRCEIFDPARAGKYEIVVFQKRYDEESLDLAGDLRRHGTKVIFDMCDNHYHYELDRPEAVAARCRLLDDMIGAVDLVTTSTPTLAEVLRQRTGRRSVVIDDAVGQHRFPSLWLRRLTSPRRKRQTLRLVWFGSAGMEHPPFGLIDLQRLLPLLEEVGREVPLSLTVISNSRPLFDRYFRRCSLPVSYQPWRRRTFPYDLAGHDIALIPVNRNPLTLCKTNNRPLLSLLLGVPVVCDTIPSYVEFEDFVMLSKWELGLKAYARDRELVRKHVAAGRRFIRAKYTPQRVSSQWGVAFETLMDDGEHHPTGKGR